MRDFYSGIQLSTIAMFFDTMAPEETKDFVGRVAREFSIAGSLKTNSPHDPEHKVFSLDALRSGNVDLSDITLLLPEKDMPLAL